jgi:site-specific DNA-methyltransferase (adenine-specific)
LEVRFIREPTAEEIYQAKAWSSTSQEILETVKIKRFVATKQLEQLTGYKSGTVRAQVSILRRMGLIKTENEGQDSRQDLEVAVPVVSEQSTKTSQGTSQTISLREIPNMAKDEPAASRVFDKQATFPTSHGLCRGDSRRMDEIQKESVHLIVTSPPYWTLKEYRPITGQLGTIKDYEKFLGELTKVISECYRVLIPGGRFICIVGDVCLPRRKAGRHVVFPLHSDIVVRARTVGFDNLSPIIWYKIANARYEANTYSTILGKPYEPNSVIKNDIEFILIQRKPGQYRKPTVEQRKVSFIPRKYYEQWHRQIWDLRGASTREHPAPFPLELALRLVRMYSFVGDMVLDPFVGTGTTMLAALMSGRNSIGYEIDPEFADLARRKLLDESSKLLCNSRVHFSTRGNEIS